MRVKWEKPLWVKTNQNRSKRGEYVTVKKKVMSPSMFLLEAPRIRFDRDSIKSIKKAIRKGERIENAWLEYRENKLVEHEGRHRAKSLEELKIKKMPVFLIKFS